MSRARSFFLLCGVGIFCFLSYNLVRMPVLALFAQSLGAGPESYRSGRLHLNAHRCLVETAVRSTLGYLRPAGLDARRGDRIRAAAVSLSLDP